MARLRPQFRMPPGRGSGHNPRNDADATFLDLHISVVDCCCTLPVLPLHAMICDDWLEVAGMANFKMYLLRYYCLYRVLIVFTIHRRHRRKKWWTRILKFEFCDFWEFFEIFKRRRAVPLRPIWTIMVAAKLDQSRVLVTKFRQNRLTLKGRSAGQRHTDRQTWLKIMALQVCNRVSNSNNNLIYKAHGQVETGEIWIVL